MPKPPPQTREGIKQELYVEGVTAAATRILDTLHTTDLEAPAMVHALAHAMGTLVGNHFLPEHVAQVLASGVEISTSVAEDVAETRAQGGMTAFILHTDQDPT